MERGAICYTTVVGGLGHDQGTRPWVVISRPDVTVTSGEALALPISHVQPAWDYPLSWLLPDGVLPRRCWVLVNRPRAILVSRLRDPVALLTREHVDEVVAGLLQIIGVTRSP